jgi:biopolymer transport protein ExbD
MMRAATHNEDDADLGFQIAPMVDVVFVLMLFFMVTAAFQVTEDPLKTTLLRPSTVYPHTAITPVTIVIAADGSVVVQDKEMAAPRQDCSALRAWMKTTRTSFGADDPGILQPAPTVRHARIMQVLAAVKAAGCQNVRFQ